jgi:hypothetical protein
VERQRRRLVRIDAIDERANIEDCRGFHPRHGRRKHDDQAPSRSS